MHILLILQASDFGDGTNHNMQIDLNDALESAGGETFGILGDILRDSFGQNRIETRDMDRAYGKKKVQHI